MTTLLVADILALLITVFVAGALIGLLFIPPVRRKVTDTVKKIAGKRPQLLLKRAVRNPILTPRMNHWENEAVMNPAAARIGNRTHLIYRAIGADGVSRLGHASSIDGTLFDKRTVRPVYTSPDFRHRHNALQHYNPVLYPSGGSWGGCEDPRMVVIGDRLYLTYSAFDGWDFIRMAVASISLEDFTKERWHWSQATLLSPPGQIAKNWVLFPEKIHGKFAILHSLAPTIGIAYRDTLESIGVSEPFIQSEFTVHNTGGTWESRLRGAGPPPLKTPLGWLILYHAMDRDDPGRYKLGAMLLDLNDPTQVLHRAPHPILEPDEIYENDGKPGIVYACGAIEQDGMLVVYYGGGDKIVAVASTPMNEFLYTLTHDETPTLETHIIHPTI